MKIGFLAIIPGNPPEEIAYVYRTTGILPIDGLSPHAAVSITQIWTAVSVYVLVAIVKKQMRLDDLSLYTILQILIVILFEKASLLDVLAVSRYNTYSTCNDNELKLLAINRRVGEYV